MTNTYKHPEALLRHWHPNFPYIMEFLFSTDYTMSESSPSRVLIDHSECFSATFTLQELCSQHLCAKRCKIPGSLDTGEQSSTDGAMTGEIFLSLC